MCYIDLKKNTINYYLVAKNANFKTNLENKFVLTV